MVMETSASHWVDMWSVEGHLEDGSSTHNTAICPTIRPGDTGQCIIELTTREFSDEGAGYDYSCELCYRRVL